MQWTETAIGDSKSSATKNSRKSQFSCTQCMQWTETAIGDHKSSAIKQI